MATTTARAVADKLRATLKAKPPGSSPRDDGFKAGDPNAVIQRILVCQSPSVGVIKQVKAGGTLVISREDPFYLTLDTAGSTANMDWSNNLETEIASNPIVAAKRSLIEGRGAVCYKAMYAWDAAKPGALSASLAKALGVTPATGPEKSAAYGTVAPTTLAQLGQDVSAKLKIRSLRAHGDPKLPVKKVVVLNGLVEIPRLAAAIADPSVDAVILGETCEWEATPYFDDIISEGRKIGMLLVGYQTSDKYGVSDLATFVRTLAGGIPVDEAYDEEPGWIA